MHKPTASNNGNLAQGLSQWLIDIYEIQAGFGLAKYLGQASHCSNYDAVYWWVKAQLESQSVSLKTYGDLRQLFASQLPFLGYEWVTDTTDMRLFA